MNTVRMSSSSSSSMISTQLHSIKQHVWWKHGIIYQIYPRSFYDSNDDGIGDIPGIIEKFDYLVSLGIDAIWLSPIYSSPMYDCGYDISDYYSIDPCFGTLSDFKNLLAIAHSNNIKIIMDMVLNHTSHMHPWFIESSSSKDNPKRNWYIWHDGKKGNPPNNWKSAYLTTAWEWHQPTQQFYLHSFLKEQPDLNWRNPEVKQAMFDVMRYWLDMGVDGFRLDVINYCYKDKRFRNNPFSFNPFNEQIEKYNRNRPENYVLVQEIRELIDSYDNRMVVGEVFCYPPGNPELSASYLFNGKGLNLAFDFSLLYQPFDARKIYTCIKHWFNAIPENCWPCNVLSNHDQPRYTDKYSNDHNDAIKRLLALLLLTLRGTPFIYYGEEIGMKNCSIPLRHIVDPAGKRFWPLYKGRDSARTPMQWSDEANAGFTRGCSWLPIDSNYRTINVKHQIKDRYSLLSFFRDVIQLRKKHPALTHGTWQPIEKGRNGILAYIRRSDDETLCIILNFNHRSTLLHYHYEAQWKVLYSTHRSKFEHFADLRLQCYPYEATILKKIGDLE